jgi:predicted alpha/beta-hydrolase family hydrolase
VADGTQVDGLVCISAIRCTRRAGPDRIRDAHLGDIKSPQLFVEGTRDPFCPLDTLAAVIGKRKLKPTSSSSRR